MRISCVILRCQQHRVFVQPEHRIRAELHLFGQVRSFRHDDHAAFAFRRIQRPLNRQRVQRTSVALRAVVAHIEFLARRQHVPAQVRGIPHAQSAPVRRAVRSRQQHLRRVLRVKRHPESFRPKRAIHIHIKRVRRKIQRNRHAIPVSAGEILPRGISAPDSPPFLAVGEEQAVCKERRPHDCVPVRIPNFREHGGFFTTCTAGDFHHCFPPDRRERHRTAACHAQEAANAALLQDVPLCLRQQAAIHRHQREVFHQYRHIRLVFPVHAVQADFTRFRCCQCERRFRCRVARAHHRWAIIQPHLAALRRMEALERHHIAAVRNIRHVLPVDACLCAAQLHGYARKVERRRARGNIQHHRQFILSACFAGARNPRAALQAEIVPLGVVRFRANPHVAAAVITGQIRLCKAVMHKPACFARLVPFRHGEALCFGQRLFRLCFRRAEDHEEVPSGAGESVQMDMRTACVGAHEQAISIACVRPDDQIRACKARRKIRRGIRVQRRVYLACLLDEEIHFLLVIEAIRRGIVCHDVVAAHENFGAFGHGDVGIAVNPASRREMLRHEIPAAGIPRRDKAADSRFFRVLAYAHTILPVFRLMIRRRQLA